MKLIYIIVLLSVISTNLAKAQTTDLVTGLDFPCAFAFKGNELYYAELEGDKISKIDITDPTPVPITVLDNGINRPISLAFKDDILYIAELTGDEISKIDITDTNPTPMTVLSGLDGPLSIEIKDDFLYIGEFFGKISKIDITESVPTQIILTTDTASPYDFEFNGNDLYIADFSVSKISKIDITDTAPTPVTVLSEVDYPHAIVFDDDFNLLIGEYFNDRVIRRVNATNETVVTGVDNPMEISIHDNRLYIAESDKISVLDLEILSISSFGHELSNETKIFPNPSSDFIHVSNLNKTTKYKIYDALSSLILEGTVSNNQSINIQDLTNGIYFLKFEKRNTIKLIKK